MRPVPGVVGAVVAVQHVVARVGEVFDRFLGLFHIAAGLHVFLARERALAETLGAGDDAVAQGHREIVPARRLDRLHDIHREAVAVLEAAAVLVGALVDIRQRKLIKEIALVDRMDLDAVDAGFLQELRVHRELIDESLYLLHGHLAGRHLVRPAVR